MIAAKTAFRGSMILVFYTQDNKALRFPSPETLREAFLWEKTPKVDKTGCISLNGICYEVGIEYLRKNILVRYDPFDLSQIEVWYSGQKRRVVPPANIGEYNHNLKKPVVELEKASQSKLLRLFVEESKKRLKRDLGAFRLREEDHNERL